MSGLADAGSRPFFLRSPTCSSQFNSSKPRFVLTLSSDACSRTTMTLRSDAEEGPRGGSGAAAADDPAPAAAPAGAFDDTNELLLLPPLLLLLLPALLLLAFAEEGREEADSFVVRPAGAVSSSSSAAILRGGGGAATAGAAGAPLLELFLWNEAMAGREGVERARSNSDPLVHCEILRDSCHRELSRLLRVGRACERLTFVSTLVRAGYFAGFLLVFFARIHHVLPGIDARGGGGVQAQLHSLLQPRGESVGLGG